MVTHFIPEPLRDISYGLYAYATFDRTKIEYAVKAQEAVQQAILTAERTILATAFFFAHIRIIPLIKSPIGMVAGTFSIIALTTLPSCPSYIIFAAELIFYSGWHMAKDVHTLGLQTLQGRLNALNALICFGLSTSLITHVSYVSILGSNSPQWLEGPMQKVSKFLATSLIPLR